MFFFFFFFFAICHHDIIFTGNMRIKGCNMAVLIFPTGVWMTSDTALEENAPLPKDLITRRNQR